MADFTLVVGNGITPNQDDFQALISRADFVIALDGAADKFEGWDIVVGDMDSIENSQSQIADKCENYSDLSKALSSYRVDAIIGIEGGRVDHRLQSFTSLIETKSNAILYFDGGRACFVPNSGLEIDLEPGIKCGLFSFGITKNVTLTGTKYALKNEDFFTGSKGVGNHVLSGPVIINHEGGDLIFTWQAN